MVHFQENPSCSNPVFRRFWGDNYPFGFNNKEKVNELYGEGNGYDFGARMYDPRLGRWWSVDPLQMKYPYMTLYHFAGNNPIRFIDLDGEDYGVKINHSDKTIMIVANVYATSMKAYRQALKSAKAWNAKSITMDGYTVTFQIKVMEPIKVSEQEVVQAFLGVNFYKKNGSLKRRLYAKYERGYVKNKTYEAAENDPIGNSYAGDNGINSVHVSGNSDYKAGQTMNGKHVDMNNHKENGDMGEYEDYITHEFGHLFGLDDAGKPYYPGPDGIMEYTSPLNLISDDDVKFILKYTKDFLDGKITEPESAKVKLLENVGNSDGSNPIGVKN